MMVHVVRKWYGSPQRGSKGSRGVDLKQGQRNTRYTILQVHQQWLAPTATCATLEQQRSSAAVRSTTHREPTWRRNGSNSDSVDSSSREGCSKVTSAPHAMCCTSRSVRHSGRQATTQVGLHGLKRPPPLAP